MSAPLLRIAGLHAGYGRAEVLHGLDLEAASGAVVTVIGPNGAGKSTLLNTVMGILPARGAIVFDGQDIACLTLEERVMLGIALVPERRELFGTMPVEDNLLLGAWPQVRRRERAWRARIDDVYALFPRLAQRRRQLAGTLSGGERQMLALGRALMSSPRLLMLDEPSLGLAPFLVAEIFDIVKRINREQGLSVLLVEQNAVAALEVVSHGYLMENGRIVMHDSAQAMKRNPDIQEFYLGGHEGKDFSAIKHYSRRKRWLS
jgi:branched-chain amino acid transport system ATP-binding protein